MSPGQGHDERPISPVLRLEIRIPWSKFLRTSSHWDAAQNSGIVLCERVVYADGRPVAVADEVAASSGLTDERTRIGYITLHPYIRTAVDWLRAHLLTAGAEQVVEIPPGPRGDLDRAIVDAPIEGVVDPQRAEHVIAALRLAVEAAKDPEALRKVVIALLAKGPISDSRATMPVHLLIDAVHESDSKFEVVS